MATTKNEMLDALLQRMDAALEKDVKLPWQGPWDPKYGELSAPHNPTTERLYSPLNGLILSTAALEHGFDDPRWMGFNQAKEQGWSVRRGEHAAARIFSPIIKNEINPRTGIEEPRVAAYRGTPLFNAAQMDGIPPMREIPEQERLPKTVELDAIAQQMGVAILHSGSGAFYSPGRDRIQLPDRNTFADQHGYDATKAHELSHATGHESRLDRDSLRQYTSIKGRAAEEMTAEIGAYLLSTRLGVPFMGNNPDMTDAQHAAYLTTWARDLSPDERRAAIEQGIKAAGHLEKQLGLARENGLVTELEKHAPATMEKLQINPEPVRTANGETITYTTSKPVDMVWGPKVADYRDPDKAQSMQQFMADAEKNNAPIRVFMPNSDAKVKAAMQAMIQKPLEFQNAGGGTVFGQKIDYKMMDAAGNQMSALLLHMGNVNPEKGLHSECLALIPLEYLSKEQLDSGAKSAHFIDLGGPGRTDRNADFVKQLSLAIEGTHFKRYDFVQIDTGRSVEAFDKATGEPTTQRDALTITRISNGRSYKRGLLTNFDVEALKQCHEQGPGSAEREVAGHDMGATPDVKAAMRQKPEKVLSGPSDKNVVAMGDLMAGDFVRVSTSDSTRHTDAIVLKVTKEGISGKIIQPVREKIWMPEPVPGSHPTRDSHWMFAAGELKTELKPGGAYISAHEPNAVPGIARLDPLAKAGLATDGEKLALHMSLNRFMKDRGEAAIARTSQPLHKITLTHRTDLKDRVCPVSIPGKPDLEMRNHPRQAISGVLKDFSKSEFILDTREFGTVRVETGKNMFMEREEELRNAVGKPVDIALDKTGKELTLAVHQGLAGGSQGVSVLFDKFDTPARPFGLMSAVDMGKTTAKPVTGKLTHVHDSNVIELRLAGKPLQGATPLPGATPVLVYGPEPDKAHQAEIRNLIGKQVRVSVNKDTGRLAVKAIQPTQQQDIGLER